LHQSSLHQGAIVRGGVTLPGRAPAGLRTTFNSSEAEIFWISRLVQAALTAAGGR
jgi:hypothetical protein